MQPLRLLQHLPVAAAKLSQDSVGYVGDALGWVAEGTPQGLQHRVKSRGNISFGVGKKRSRALNRITKKAQL